MAGALVLEDAAGQLVAALGLPGTPAAVVTDAHGRVLSTVAAGSAEILAMLPAPANSDPHPLELRT